MNGMQRLLLALERGSLVYERGGLVLESPTKPRLEPGIVMRAEELAATREFVDAASALVQSIAESGASVVVAS